MRKSLEAHVWVLALLALSGCSRAASAQGALGRTAVHPRGVDAAVAEASVEVAVDREGRVRWTERRRWEVVTDYGMDYHADPELYHDSARQTLDVALARTTMVDGTVVPTPPSGINELMPDALVDAPAYSALRRTVISHVGVEPGAVAELDVTVSDREPTAWSPGGVVPLAGPMPAARVRVRVASSHGTLRSACVRCEPAPRVGDGPEGATHDYELADLPALDTYELGRNVGDGRLPTDFVPRVVFSTAASWRDEAAALARRVDEAARGGEALAERARALGRDVAGPVGLLEALQAFVAGELDTIGLDQRLLGYAPARAEETLGRSYGSPLDKAVLLLALLRASGLEASLVLASRDSEIAAEVPWLGQLEQVWVRAAVEGQELWMPPGAPLVLPRSALPGDLWALDLARPGPPERLAPARPEASSSRLVADLRLAASGALTGELTVLATGPASPYGELRGRGQGGERALAREAAGFGPGAAVEDGTTLRFGPHGLEARGRLAASAAVEGDGAVRTVPLPWPAVSPFGPIELRESRQTPLELRGPGLRASRIAIALPSGLRPEGLPAERTVRNPVGWVSQAVTVEDGRVEVSRELGVTRRVVEPEAWAELRALLVEAEAMGREVLVLLPGPRSEP